MRLALYPLVQQFQYRNGTNLVAGKIYVYYRGRTRLATIYKDQNGTIAQNPLTCDADGRAPCFVDTNYQYTIVVCDARGKELFSQDLDADNAININDALSGDSKLYIINSDGTISVNATSGDTWIQYDLGTFNKPLGVIEPLYWHQDDEEASIIGLHTEGLVSGISADFTELSAKVDELSGDVSYLSGASDYLSGVVEQKMDKSMSSDFYPSNNPSGFIGDEGLSNYQPVSGMTAYQEKGNYYSASNPSGFITGVDLSDYAKTEDLTAYQEKGDYYSASNPSGFINSDAISDMATTGFVADVSADITAMIPTALTGDYLTKESADTLYQPIGDYVDETELSTVSADITAMIPTALTGDYLDKASADTLYYGINNPSGFITGVDLSPYQTIEGMTAFQPVGNYQTAGDYYSASNPSGFITNDAITGLQPSGDYATNTQLSEVSSTITAMIPSGEYELCAGSGIELVDDPNAKTTTISVTAQGGNPEVEAEVIAHSADWNTVTDKLDTTAFSDVSGDFLTAHQDLSDYQTVEGMTAYQSVGEYLSATESANYLLTSDSANFYTTANESGYLTAVPDTYLQNTDLTISEGKITEISGVPLSAGDELPIEVSAATDYITANSGIIDGTVETVSSNSGTWGGEPLPISSRDGIDLELTGDMLWIGASALTASIDEKLDAEVYAADSANFLTAHQSLEGYLQNTDLEISDNKITGISGVPLAAGGGGGDVPEGVMAESGLEFNAVNEISGYNGSAIAQYGAEKQWLVHDDTLVHAANSAQYALGVNLSAVAQLLGVDETVLYSGKTYSATLSESVKNFKKIGIAYGPNNYYNNSLAYFETETFSANDGLRGVHLDFTEHNGANAYCFPKSQTYTFNSTFTEMNGMGGIQYRVSGNAIQSEGTGNMLYIYKVIGIGRKQ